MERTRVRRTILQAAGKVLETAAFTWVEEEECGSGLDFPDPVIAARMDFNASTPGFLAIAVPGDLGYLLAANMLGDEDEPRLDRRPGLPSSYAVDAVMELLNMTGMILMESLFEGEGATASPPRRIPFLAYRQQATARPWRETLRVGLATEDGTMELLLAMETCV